MVEFVTMPSLVQVTRLVRLELMARLLGGGLLLGGPFFGRRRQPFGAIGLGGKAAPRLLPHLPPAAIVGPRSRALIVLALSGFSAFFRSAALDLGLPAGAGAAVVNPMPMSKLPRPPGSSSVWSRPAINASSAAGSVAVASSVLRTFFSTASVAPSAASMISWMAAMRASDAARGAVAEPADRSPAWASASAAISSGRSRASR